MSKVLVWNVDEEHPLFSERTFPIYPMTLVGANRYEMDLDGELEGIIHPATEELVQLKGSFEDYGVVYDSDDAPEGHDIFAEDSPDIGVRLEMGTPTLTVEEDE
jgi:hypothetical protein